MENRVDSNRSKDVGVLTNDLGGEGSDNTGSQGFFVSEVNG